MPQRRCVGCGRVAPKATLVRLALGPAPAQGRRTVRLDRAQRLPGRGAYICRDPASGAPAMACLRRAIQRGGVSRALRASVSIPDDFVESSH